MVPTVLDALGIEPPTPIRGVTQSPIEGVSRSRTRSTTPRRRRAHHTQYFEMIGHRAIYHDGWRAVCPVPGPSFAEAGMGFGEMAITEEKLRELDAQGLGALPRRRGLLGDQEPRRRAPRQADRDDRALVRRGGQVQRAADRQPRHGAPRRRAAAARARRATATSTTRARRWSRTRSPPRVLNRPHSITATVEIAERRRGRAGRAGRHRPAATRSTSRTTSCTTPTTSSACSSSTSRPTTTVADGRHELRFEFEPTGKPDLAHGKGTPAHAQLYVDGKLAGAGRPAGHHPARHRHHRGPDVRARRRLGGDDRLPGAVRLHRRAREGRRRRLGRAHRGQGRRDARR